MNLKRIMRMKPSLYLFSLLAISFAITPITIEAQSQSNKKPIKYKKARALQSSTAKKMAKVYEALEVVDEKGEPAPDMDTVTVSYTHLTLPTKA